MWKQLQFPTKLCLILFLLLCVKVLLVTGADAIAKQREQDLAQNVDSVCVGSEDRQFGKTRTGKLDGKEVVLSQDQQTAGKNGAEAEKIEATDENSAEAEKIQAAAVVRIRISDSLGNPFHENLTLTGTADFVVGAKGEQETYAKGTALELADYFTQKKLTDCRVELQKNPENTKKCCVDQSVSARVLENASESSECFARISEDSIGGEKDSTAVSGICCLSLEKGGVHPVYPGALLIHWDAEKQAFTLINEVAMEWYLPGVVSSEMPDSFGLEALKTQAVCARSYAAAVVAQKNRKQAEKTAEETSEDSEEFGSSWDLEDTTNDQVYMSGKVDWQAVLACTETKGEMLYEKGTLVKPHYYSTSWGEAADGAVFQKKSFQTLKVLEASALDLSQEAIRAKNQEFIQAYRQMHDAYDASSPWFRWSASLSLAKLGEENVKEIWVTERGKGGYVSELLLWDKHGEARRVSGAAAVREALGSEETVYSLQDGSTRKGLSILPSAFFYLEEGEVTQEKTVRIYGGGFGHGYGVSQYGAAEMAKEGKLYREILAYYYPNAEVF